MLTLIIYNYFKCNKVFCLVFQTVFKLNQKVYTNLTELYEHYN